jgi:hypothetical protein
MKYWKEITLKEQLKRWHHVLRVLEALTPHQRRRHWNMETWGEKTECGTVACAAGHCALDPWFRRQGFKSDFYPDGTLKSISNATAFFGFEGTDRIFHNAQKRSVPKVIAEVKLHIKTLEGTDE